ncbi:MAG: DNA/RNA nuclease SfsA [Gammaproteobacteria bacterium]
MDFDKPLIKGSLIKRYKRFLADVKLENGEIVTAHSPNTGSMTGCSTPGSRVWLRDTGNPDRKYPLSWELVEAEPDVLVGINTGLANTIVKEGIERGIVTELEDYTTIRSEIRYGKENSRIDLLLEEGPERDCYVEIKSVTLVKKGIGLFPDAVSQRGSKHLRELDQMVQNGYRGVIFYCVQRGDAVEVRPADRIDPLYGETLRRVMARGVETLAYSAEVSPQAIRLCRRLPVFCP